VGCERKLLARVACLLGNALIRATRDKKVPSIIPKGHGNVAKRICRAGPQKGGLRLSLKNLETQFSKGAAASGSGNKGVAEKWLLLEWSGAADRDERENLVRQIEER